MLRQPEYYRVCIDLPPRPETREWTPGSGPAPGPRLRAEDEGLGLLPRVCAARAHAELEGVKPVVRDGHARHSSHLGPRDGCPGASVRGVQPGGDLLFERLQQEGRESSRSQTESSLSVHNGSLALCMLHSFNRCNAQCNTRLWAESSAALVAYGFTGSCVVA